MLSGRSKLKRTWYKNFFNNNQIVEIQEWIKRLSKNTIHLSFYIFFPKLVKLFRFKRLLNYVN